MDEAERCNQIAYIYLSKLMVKGSPKELKELKEVTPANTRRVAVSVENPAVALSKAKQAPFTLDATLVEAEIHLQVKSDISPDEILEELKKLAVEASGIREIEPSLEDVFVALTREYGEK
jgi:ABC-type multidrug transport system ATPase subunit